MELPTLVLRLTVTFMFEPAFLLIDIYPQSLSAFGQQKSGNNPSSIKLSSMALFHRPRSFPLFRGYCSPYKEKSPVFHSRNGIVRLPAYIQGQLRVQGDPMDRIKAQESITFLLYQLYRYNSSIFCRQTNTRLSRPGQVVCFIVSVKTNGELC